MTGHIPGTTVLRTSPKETALAGPGSNHVALRAANERLVLSLIRSHGELSKAQIAELTGLTAQTASVISRSLVEAGLLTEGARVRGKVGQPYVPLSLNPDGALFLGVHVERQQAKAALVNFTGGVIAEKTAELDAADLKRLASFVLETASRFRSAHSGRDSSRFQGIGVSVAGGGLGSARRRLPWSEVEAAFGEVSEALDVAVLVSSDAVAACSAELIYGLGSGLGDFLYLFLDESVSGGLVQGGRIRFSRDETGANLGRVPVFGADGRVQPLGELTLSGRSRPPTQKAIEALARGIAYAVTAAVALVPCSTVIIDGSIARDVLQQVGVKLRSALAQLGATGAAEIAVREGSLDRKSIALGGACLPLADRFFPAD